MEQKNIIKNSQIQASIVPPPAPVIKLTYEKKQTRTVKGTITAYSSSIEETDDTPFTTASGSMVSIGTIANNCLPFGTRVKLEQKEYVVLDRLNSRYGCEHWDIWKPSKEAALQFGRQWKEITIIE